MECTGIIFVPLNNTSVVKVMPMSSNPLLPEDFVETQYSRFTGAFITRIVTGSHILKPGFSFRWAHEAKSLIFQVSYGEKRSSHAWLYTEIDLFENPEAIAQRTAHSMLVDVGLL